MSVLPAGAPPAAGPAESALSPNRLAAVAFGSAGLFAAVNVGMGAARGARWVEYTGLGFHLLLLPLAARLDAPDWARAMGYAWIAVDGTVSVALINGQSPEAPARARLGGHVLASVWIAAASQPLPARARLLGRALAACLGGHSLVAPFTRRPVLLYAAGPLMVAWLAAVGAALRRGGPPAAPAPAR